MVKSLLRQATFQINAELPGEILCGCLVRSCPTVEIYRNFRQHRHPVWQVQAPEFQIYNSSFFTPRESHALTNFMNRATARYQVWTRLGQCKAAFQEQCCDQTTTANTTHERTNRKHFARHKAHKAAARARAGHVAQIHWKAKSDAFFPMNTGDKPDKVCFRERDARLVNMMPFSLLYCETLFDIWNR